jgi:chemotaxis protein CheC
MSERPTAALRGDPGDHMSRLSPAELQMLSRLCQLGGGRAGRALATILGASGARVDLFDAGLREHAHVANELGGGHAPMIGVLFDLTGSFEGHLTMLLGEAGALTLVRRLLRTEQVTRPDGSLTDDAHGTLAEVGNIVASAFLNAFADAMRSPWLPSTPRLIHGRGDAILAAIKGRGLADRALTIALDAQIREDSTRVRGQLLFLPAAPVLTNLVRAARGGGAP